MITKISLLFAAGFWLSAWTFELIDKPGSDALIEGQKARDLGQYQQSEQYFQTAIEEAIDNGLKSRALTGLAQVKLRQQPMTAAIFDEAIDLLKQADKLGYQRANFAIAEAYREYGDTPAAKEVAQNYYKKVEKIYPAASLGLAALAENPQAAKEYIEQGQAMLEEDPTPSTQAMQVLASYFNEGRLVARNVSLAEYWYNRAALDGSVSAMMDLAELWQTENHQPGSDIVALWKKAAELGNQDAFLQLGFAYQAGRLVEQDSELAQRYFEKASEFSNENTYKIARKYEELSLANRAYRKKAVGWMNLAAKQQHPDAVLWQARQIWEAYKLREDGNVKQSKLNQARRLYRLSADLGSEKAGEELMIREQRLALQRQKRIEKAALLAEKRRKKALEKSHSPDAVQRFTQGLDFWLPKAEAGDLQSMVRVGEAYIQGSGTTPDATKGREWITRAANKGSGEAMYVLAELYNTGLDVEMDIAKAYEWYAKSANAGYAAGQYQLGLGYARGLGVQQNNAKAREWLQKAQKNGYKQADAVLKNLIEGEQS
jgi:TPR repeat protein